MRRVFSLILVALCCTLVLSSQTRNWSFSITTGATYTTSAKIFYNPDSPSAELRSQSNDFDGLYGGNIEIRFLIPAYDLSLSLYAEYLSKTRDEFQYVGSTSPAIQTQVKEVFRIFPIELGIYVNIPVGGESIRLAMGGGLGVYYGVRTLQIGGVKALQENNPLAFGIHVGTNFDYRVNSRISFRAQMRFRDPEVITESRFESPAAIINDQAVLISRDIIKSKINVNGLCFGLGIVIDL
ncbi:MAG: hypothetical protein V1799_04220 [bacterium]